MTEEQRNRKQQTNERIGQRVAALRRQAGLTQTALADRAGIQRTHLVRIESGKYDVTLPILQFIAEALGMTVDIIDPALTDFVRIAPPPAPPEGGE